MRSIVSAEIIRPLSESACVRSSDVPSQSSAARDQISDEKRVEDKRPRTLAASPRGEPSENGEERRRHMLARDLTQASIP